MQQTKKQSFKNTAIHIFGCLMDTKFMKEMGETANETAKFPISHNWE